MRLNIAKLKILIALVLFIALAPGCSGLRPGGGEQDGLLGRVTGKSKSSRSERHTELLEDEALDPLGRRSGDRFLLDDLSPSQIGTTFKLRSSEIDQQGANQYFATATETYERAIAAKQSGADPSTWQPIFVEAANNYRIAAAKWPDSGLEERAIFFEGESYFFADRYVQSNRAYERLIGEYAGSSLLDKAEERRFVISKYWLQVAESGSAVALNDPKRPKYNVAGEARRVLHNIRLDDPTGKLSDDATFELANAFLKEGRYYEAADTYEDLRRNYPGSKYLFDSHMLELEARLKSYKGPSYDASPLEKSEGLIKSIVRTFPEKAKGNMEVLEQQAALVNNQLAQRDYELGTYHERRGEKEYPDSIYSPTIGSKIQQVASLPPKPDQHAKWLVEMFPDPNGDKPAIEPIDDGTILR